MKFLSVIFNGQLIFKNVRLLIPILIKKINHITWLPLERPAVLRKFKNGYVQRVFMPASGMMLKSRAIPGHFAKNLKFSCRFKAALQAMS